MELLLDLDERRELVTFDDDDDDTVLHLWCCDEDVAVCGRSLAGYDSVDEPPEGLDQCVVCRLMTTCLICKEPLL